MQYALIFYDLQLILAPMGERLRGTLGDGLGTGDVGRLEGGSVSAQMAA